MTWSNVLDLWASVYFIYKKGHEMKGIANMPYMWCYYNAAPVADITNQSPIIFAGLDAASQSLFSILL